MSSVFNSARSRIWHLHPGNHCNLLKTVARSGEIRTPDLLVRSQTLYPAELRARWSER